MYGVSQFAQAATRFRVREAGDRTGAAGTSGDGVRDVSTVFGAELSLTRGPGRTGVPDPEGNHLLVLARDPDGYRRVVPGGGAAPPSGGAGKRTGGTPAETMPGGHTRPG